jgi:hypothetical protein
MRGSGKKCCRCVRLSRRSTVVTNFVPRYDSKGQAEVSMFEKPWGMRGWSYNLPTKTTIHHQIVTRTDDLMDNYIRRTALLRTID